MKKLNIATFLLSTLLTLALTACQEQIAPLGNGKCEPARGGSLPMLIDPDCNSSTTTTTTTTVKK